MTTAAGREEQAGVPVINREVGRRGFLVSAGAIGVLALGFSSPLFGPRAWARGTTSTLINTWVQIGSDESITVFVGSSEMGQGVYTSLPQLVAEELRVDWDRVAVSAAPADPAYANPATGAELTGGSMSVRGYYTALRTAGAAIREMLRQAAADRFGVPVDSCVAAHGVITVSGTGQSATYGQLAAAASALPVPTDPPLTPPEEFQLIGTSVPRLDLPDKVRGAATYGIDVRVPGMQHAVVVHCPSVAGTLVSAGPTPPGATALVATNNAVIVVAATTWDAMRAARQLSPTWSIPASASQLSDSAIAATAAQLMSKGTPAVAEKIGNATRAIAGAATALDATYSVPYLPHATMEPLACTASVTATGCEVWAPTQAPGLVAAVAAQICGIDPSRVTVTTTLLGGGLGRKFETDYVSQAVTAAKAVGTPVKLTWPREQDFGHDQYRPMALMRVRAGLSSRRKLVGWYERIVSPSILGQRGWIPPGAVDSQAVDGAVALPYAISNRLVEYVAHPAAIPVGFWRSVGNSLNCFAVESAMDELALLAGVEPLRFRLGLLAPGSRPAAVLTALSALCNWPAGAPAGRARGLALTSSFGSIVGQVAEVSSTAGALTVENVWCVIDCGQVVNPDIVVAQMQGGIVHGLTAALFGRMSFTRGVATPTNFDDYRVTRMRDMPAITVSIMPGTAAPGGVGEPGVPPVAPAVANAWSRLTGTRRRTLPLVGGGG